MYIYIPIDIYTPINSLSRERQTDYVLCAQSCLTLRPHGLKPPGPPVHGIFQAKILEWIAISFSKKDYRK